MYWADVGLGPSGEWLFGLSVLGPLWVKFEPERGFDLSPKGFGVW